HGIGGAKYDELTDDIIRRFYGLAPPAYMVLSATLRLPLPMFQATPEQCRRQAGVGRDLWYNPQPPLARAQKWKLGYPGHEKQSWLERDPATAVEKKERFDKLRALTAALRDHVGLAAEQARGNLARCRAEVEANAVLGRRDYAFCLFPEEMLRPFCT